MNPKRHPGNDFDNFGNLSPSKVSPNLVHAFDLLAYFIDVFGRACFYYDLLLICVPTLVPTSLLLLVT